MLRKEKKFNDWFSYIKFFDMKHIDFSYFRFDNAVS